MNFSTMTDEELSRIPTGTLHEETDRILFAMRTAGYDDVADNSTGWTRDELEDFVVNYSDGYPADSDYEEIV